MRTRSFLQIYVKKAEEKAVFEKIGKKKEDALLFI